MFMASPGLSGCPALVAISASASEMPSKSVRMASPQSRVSLHDW